MRRLSTVPVWGDSESVSVLPLRSNLWLPPSSSVAMVLWMFWYLQKPKVVLLQEHEDGTRLFLWLVKYHWVWKRISAPFTKTHFTIFGFAYLWAYFLICIALHSQKKRLKVWVSFPVTRCRPNSAVWPVRSLEYCTVPTLCIHCLIFPPSSLACFSTFQFKIIVWFTKHNQNQNIQM